MSDEPEPICRVCGVAGPSSDFFPSELTRKARGKGRPACKACLKSQQLLMLKRRGEARVAARDLEKQARVAAAEARCRHCGESKPKAEFWASEAEQKRPLCMVCSKRKQAAWRQENRDARKKYMTAWHAANPEKMLEHSLMSRYGVTVEQYQGLLDGQDGLCACCGKFPTERLLVDHDHDTGRIRGLVCRPCNTGIGMLGDSAEGVRCALSYLERSPSVHVQPASPGRRRRYRGRRRRDATLDYE